MSRQAVPIALLDGGLGTTLQAAPYEQTFDRTTPLWSSHLLISRPDLLRRVHADFVEAGADIILTATYQASFEGFAQTPAVQSSDAPIAQPLDAPTAQPSDAPTVQPSDKGNAAAGYAAGSAADLMRSAVPIARAAVVGGRARRRPSLPAASPAVALSLGPYGATLVPSQEYGGVYPAEMGSQQALRLWHSRRVDVFGNDPTTRRNIDLVAWETMRRTDEVLAVREIMSLPNQPLLEAGYRGEPGSRKKWWISTVWPDEPTERDVEAMVRAMLADRPWSPESRSRQAASSDETPSSSEPVAMAAPWGIGINCTAVEKITKIVEHMEASIARMEREGDWSRPWPWLVLYPNGSSTSKYDSGTMEWVAAEPPEDQRPWDVVFWESIQDIQHRDKWSGILAGGCCMTLPRDIATLRERIDATHLGSW